MAHYVQCPRIYACCKYVYRDSPPCPLSRCGLHDPRTHNLLMFACVFGAYHALKNQIRMNFGAEAVDNMDYEANWIFFARHLHAEAVERSLVRSLFNPSQFAVFLNSL